MFVVCIGQVGDERRQVPETVQIGSVDSVDIVIPAGLECGVKKAPTDGG